MACSNPTTTPRKPSREVRSKFVGWIVAFIMAVGSCFAAANTMYAAVAYRGREIATLRVIGFSRPSILTSFMLESLLLSLLGATLGIILMLPFNGMTTGTQNQVTFSEVVFSLQMTPAVVADAQSCSRSLWAWWAGSRRPGTLRGGTY